MLFLQYPLTHHHSSIRWALVAERSSNAATLSLASQLVGFALASLDGLSAAQGTSGDIRNGPQGHTHTAQTTQHTHTLSLSLSRTQNTGVHGRTFRSTFTRVGQAHALVGHRRRLLTAGQSRPPTASRPWPSPASTQHITPSAPATGSPRAFIFSLLENAARPGLSLKCRVERLINRGVSERKLDHPGHVSCVVYIGHTASSWP